MLSGRYPSGDFSAFRPRIIWQRESGQLTARPGAHLLAVTSGGTIPDRGMFSVLLPEGEEQVPGGGSLMKRWSTSPASMTSSRWGNLLAHPANHP
jgi:Lhr-like helicase